MAITQEQLEKVNYLRASVRLQSPDTETDPVYKFSDDELFSIFSVVTPTHNPNYTFDSLPENEFNFVVLLAKKELYYRLATSTAPFYPLSAEGASLQKNVRFDHYMSLLKQVTDEYAKMVQLWKDSEFGTIQTYDTVSQARYFSRRAFNLATKPTVELSISGITATSVNLDWTKYSVPNGLFAHYTISVEKTPLIDEYAEYRRRTNASPYIFFSDIHRLKYRVGDIFKLEPDTDYFISVVTEDRNGLYGYSEKQIRTLPIS
jgi:hypothetical protein